MKKINKHAQELGRIKTKKKAEASRRNGKLGGRPRKLSTVCTCGNPTIG
jgi:hypothetical protein